MRNAATTSRIPAARVTLLVTREVMYTVKSWLRASSARALTDA